MVVVIQRAEIRRRALTHPLQLCTTAHLAYMCWLGVVVTAIGEYCWPRAWSVEHALGPSLQPQRRVRRCLLLRCHGCLLRIYLLLMLQQLLLLLQLQLLLLLLLQGNHLLLLRNYLLLLLTLLLLLP